MFCSNCGKQVIDDCAFCPSCGKPLKSTDPSAPAPTTLSELEPTSFADLFCISFRKFINSPFFVIILIAYSISQLINMGQIKESLDIIREFVDILSLLAIIAPIAEYILNFIGVIIFVPSALYVISLWLFYWDNREQNFEIINTRGIQIISIVYRVQQILFILVILAIEIFLSIVFQHDSTGFLIGIAVLIIGVMGFLAYQWPILMFRSMSTAASYLTPTRQYITPCAVLYFVSSGIQIIGVASVGLTLSSLIVSCAHLLVGILILKYKTLMEKMYTEHSEAYRKERVVIDQPIITQEEKPSPAPSVGGYSPDYIPAWKRVQLAQRESEQSNE